MNYKQVIFIIVANVLNTYVSDALFEPLSTSWYTYLIGSAVWFAICSQLLKGEKK
jgi:hypothetical protein